MIGRCSWCQLGVRCRILTLVFFVYDLNVFVSCFRTVQATVANILQIKGSLKGSVGLGLRKDGLVI